MRTLHVLAFVCLALTLTGCARLHARAEPVVPPLEIPAPPPKVIAATLPATATATSTAAPEVPQAEEPPPAAPAPPAGGASRRPPARPPARTATAGSEDKPEGSAPAAVPAPAPARPAGQNGGPATLQTTTNVGEIEQKVRATIAQASRDLNRVDAAALNAEAKAQFDIARRFVQQAGEAVTAKNFVFAGQLADKAAALAALLMAR